MLRWHTEKRWKYKGRTCEIQRLGADDPTQYRGLVELEIDVPDDELDAADLRHTRRPKRRQRGEDSVWVYRSWSAPTDTSPLASRREAVEALAERIASEAL